MNVVLSFFKKWFGITPEDPEPLPTLDLERAIEQIQKSEKASQTEPGRPIFKGRHTHFDIRLDRDITGHYRITAFYGTEKAYSFSVYSETTDFKSLSSAFKTVTGFLEGERNLRDLPDDDLVKGHYFGIEE